MKQHKTIHLKRQLQILVCFFIISICPLANAQTTPSVMFTWDVNVGCQLFNPAKDHVISVESIQPSNCIRVCEKSTVVYTLRGLPDLNPTVQWTVTGGSASTAVTNNDNTSSISVQWGGVGSGSITFSYVNSNNTTITMTQCFEVISIPKALFSVYPLEVQDLIKPFVIACTGQTLYFNDLSTSVGTSGIVSWFWDFGDSENTSNYTSTAQNPTHIYTTQGNYIVTLTVTNSCGCSSIYRKKITIKGEGGFEISCPVMVCEGQTSTYNLPLEAQGACNEFHYDSLGGTIGVINQDTGSVQVTWDHVDATGFGFLTFETQNGGCNLPCLNPTTIRIPVIQNHGTIQGPSSICMGNQGIYRLPQWPTTDFEWEVEGNQNGDLATLILNGQRNEIVITPLHTGTLILKAVYTNTLLNCGGTATFTINVVDGIDFDGDFEVCQNTTGSYHTLDNSSATWILTNSQGSTITTQNNTSSFDYTFTQAGVYTLSTGSVGSCLAEQKKIVVIALPSPININEVKVLTSIIENASTAVICPNENYTFSLTNTPSFQTQWSVTNGSILGSSIGDEVVVKFNGTSPSLLTVRRVSNSNTSCPSVPLNIPIQLKEITAEIQNSNTTVCTNSSTNYQVNQTGTNNLYSDGESYEWSLSNPNMGSITSGQNTNQISIMWNNALTTTNVHLNLVIHQCGMTRTLSLPIAIVNVPSITISPSNTTICSGDSVVFTVSSSDPSFPLNSSNIVTWNFGGGDQPGNLNSNPTPFYNASGSTNITHNVTAYVVNPNGCIGRTATVNALVNVIPSPGATNSLIGTSNTFCTPSEIDANLAASVSTDVISIQWYVQTPSGIVSLTGANTTTLHVSGTTGFGNYYFIAINGLGCSKRSNNVAISQGCIPLNCPTVNPYSLQNNSTQSCNVIHLLANVGGSPTNQYWDIYGPDGYHYNVTSNSYTVNAPGVYHTIINVIYVDPQTGQSCPYSDIKNVTVPFVASFKQTTVCNANNNFTINLIDTSNYYTGVAANCNIYYYYRLTTPGNTGNWTLINSNSQTLNSGSYDVKMAIEYNGVTCEVTKSFTYTTIPNAQHPTVDQPTCYDSAANFGFAILITNDDSFLWTFEPGVENTLSNPKRVFNTSGMHSVSVVLTNKSGCSKLYDNIQVNVPEKCFKGDVVVSPNTGVVCKGSPVTLTYQPNADTCIPTQYVWMNGNDVIPGAANSPSLVVFVSGVYWVKVANTNCHYDTPSRINPTFISPPTLQFNGPETICEGKDAAFSVSSNADHINWYIDGVLAGALIDQWTAILNGLSEGTHTIGVEVSSSMYQCSISQVRNLNVLFAPDAPQIVSTVYCANEDPDVPYYHIDLKATSNVAEYYNWSNGMNGSTITVQDGGAYEVTVRSGGCSASSTITVAKNPEDYMWLFPTGCFEYCKTDSNNQEILAPVVLVKEWEWLYNGTVASEGNNSIPDNLVLTDSGDYQLSLTNPDCTVVSAPLHYTVTHCEKCKIEAVEIVKIVSNSETICSYAVEMSIISSINMSVTVTALNNNAIILPSGFSLLVGLNNCSFTIIPLGNFSGGVIPMRLQGINQEGEICIFDFEIKLPPCKIEILDKKTDTTTTIGAIELGLSPNPAHESVGIRYKGLGSQGTLSLYDLIGHRLTEIPLNGNDGEMELSIKGYATGVYVVVVKTNEGLLYQQKLIIE